jgi:heat shock protein HtpX
MAVRADRRAGGPAGVAVRVATAALPLIAVCAAIGAAIAGRGGALVGLVVAAVMLAVAGAYCDRLALSAMAARPVSEVEHPELYRLVRELSKEGRLPVPRLFLSPARQPNAFTVGRNPRAAGVCCTEGLLVALDEAELRGVLGHELAHVCARDILPATVSAGLATVITSPAGLPRLLPGRAAPPRPASGAVPPRPASGAAPPRPASGAVPPPRPASGAVSSSLGVAGTFLMLVLGPLAALVIRLSVTRDREYRADAAGALLTGDPVALASALRKIEAGAVELALAPDARLTSVAHLMIASPFHPEGFARLFATQPATGERLRRLEALAGYRR